LAPKFSDEEQQPENQLKQALNETTPLVADFARVAQIIAEHNNQASALCLYHGFENLANQYDLPPGFSGQYDERDFDLFKFLGHELFVTMIGHLLRDESWEIISALLKSPLYVENGFSVDGKNQSFDYLGEYVKTLYYASKRAQRISLHADWLKERHETSPLSEVMPWTLFLEADFFLFLRKQIESEEPEGIQWRAWSSLYLGQLPRFVARMETSDFASRVVPALGVPNVESFKQRLGESGRKLNPKAIFGDGWPRPFPDISPQNIATR